MSAAILDLNDRQLTLWSAGEVVLQSPGYALLQGKQFVFGEAAREQARLQPRSINHRYWWQLGTDPMQPAFGPARHTGDLVHAHLQQIHQLGEQPEQLILAAPGSMQTEQLSLLLGIIQQCPFEAVGLVDRAVATGASDVTGPAWHIDLQLHQTLVTELGVENGEVLRKSVTPVPGCGWIAIQDRLAQAIADQFIRQTRFDPRRQAASEQQLYDSMPQLLQSLQGQAEVNLELGGRQSRLEQQALARSCAEFWQRIHAAAGSGGQLLLEAFPALLPGLREQLGSVDVVAADALYSGVEANRDALEGDASGLHFVTRLPACTAALTTTAAAPDTPAAAPEPEPATEPETKVEPGHWRIDIEDGLCTVHCLAGDPPRLNGEPVSGAQRLQAGDRLQLGNGQVLSLAGEDEDHGP